MSIEAKRKAVADDLYEDVTNDRKARSRLVDAYIATKTDDEIEQMYEDAGLSESE